jgi:ribonuclease P protein component
MAKSYTLGRSERLKSNKVLEELFSKGKRFNVPGYRVFYRQSKDEKDPFLQFGVGVGNKNFKKAVDRNRIKRLTRESWRLQKNTLQQSLADKREKYSVFFVYSGKAIPLYSETFSAVATAIQKLQLYVDRVS